jgi:hypothetical protein
VSRRPQPTPEELRAWAELCEYLARQARGTARLRLVRDEDLVRGGIAEAFDELAAFLRDLL